MRPPHSLGIFNLNEVKAMCKFAQDTFFRHFDAYIFAIQPKLLLELGPAVFFDVHFPETTNVNEESEVSIKEFPDLL